VFLIGLSTCTGDGVGELLGYDRALLLNLSHVLGEEFLVAVDAFVID